jgi:hypothetical protein
MEARNMKFWIAVDINVYASQKLNHGDGVNFWICIQQI